MCKQLLFFFLLPQQLPQFLFRIEVVAADDTTDGTGYPLKIIELCFRCSIPLYFRVIRLSFPPQLPIFSAPNALLNASFREAHLEYLN